MFWRTNGRSIFVLLVSVLLLWSLAPFGIAEDQRPASKSSGPDLVVADVIWQGCDILFKICNIGDGDANGNFPFPLFIASPIVHPSGNTTGWSADIQGLAAGECVIHTWSNMEVLSGILEVTVDPQNDICETNENNNTSTFSVPANCQACTLNVEFEKKVWDPSANQWVDQAQVQAGTVVKFYIDITNMGNCPLNNVTVVDQLPGFVQYTPGGISEWGSLLSVTGNGHTLTWSGLPTITVGHHLYIEYNAQVTSAGTADNCADLSFACDGNTISDSDCAAVIAGEGCPPCMVSYWKLEGTAGAVVEDSHNGNNGQLATGTGTNYPSWTSGIAGGALQFSGGNCVRIPHAANLNLGTGPFALEAWFKYEGPSNGSVMYPTIMSKRPEGGGLNPNGGFFLGLSYWSGSTPGSLLMRMNDINYVPGTASVDNGNWHHVVVQRCANNQVQFWIDGTLSATVTSTKNIGCAADLRLGVDSSSSSSTKWQGKLDEVAVYNCCLSASEIKSHYQAGLTDHDGYCY